MRILLILFLLLTTSAFSAETVYCIHGFMRSSSSMKKIAKAFYKEGYETNNWDYPSKRKTIEEHGETLVNQLIQTANTNPGEPIHFVTHSLGGIILRSALNHPNCPEEAKIGKAVLLAPPNRGARFARYLSHSPQLRSFFGPKAGKQLLYSQNFDFLGQFPETKKVLIISGTFGWNPFSSGENDGKVGVHESCLDTPHKHLTHFTCHSCMMWNKTVIYNTKKFIKENF